MFLLRLLIGLLCGYFICCGSFCYGEYLNKDQKITKKLILKELHDFFKRKWTLSCILMMLSCGLLAWISDMYYTQLWQSVCVFSFCACLLLIAAVDRRTMLIPNQCLYLLSIIGMPFLLPPLACSWMQRFYGIFAVSGFMMLVNLFQRDSFGYGDIKLMTICGFYLGLDCVIFAMLTAILSGGFYSFRMLLLKKAKPRTHIAFAPFLCTSLIIAHFIGSDICNAYMQLFY